MKAANKQNTTNFYWLTIDKESKMNERDLKFKKIRNVFAVRKITFYMQHSPSIITRQSETLNIDYAKT